MNAVYDASSIKVLTEDQAASQFIWKKVADLAAKYKQVPEFIERGLEACRRTGKDETYFIDKYLRNRKHIPLDPEFNEAYKELLDEQRSARWIARKALEGLNRVC